jgi:hypothetical protein
MFGLISQVLLFVLSVSATCCSFSSNLKIRRVGPILGLSSQPFWLYTAYQSSSWGIFGTAIFYTGLWTFGVYKLFSAQK